MSGGLHWQESPKFPDATRQSFRTPHGGNRTRTILFMTGYADDETVHLELLDSGVAFLHKALTPKLHAAKVREVLDSA